jgi:hypothetical protein
VGVHRTKPGVEPTSSAEVKEERTSLECEFFLSTQLLEGREFSVAPDSAPECDGF